MSAKTVICRLCPAKIERANITGLCLPCYRKCAADLKAGTPTIPPPIDPAVQVEADRVIARQKAELAGVKKKYEAVLQTVDRLEQDLGVAQALRAVDSYVIEPRYGAGTSEATPILVASDWHVEQRVTSNETNGLNEFNLDIAHERMERFFTAGLRLIQLLNQDVKIDRMVLALLGDFITGQIHGAANAEKNQLTPTEAVTFAHKHIASGIEFLLEHSKYELIIPCKIGNHSRTTEKSRFGGENGHSWEYLMYLHLKTQFASESRVRFLIDDGYHTYLPIYGRTGRFHHGHAIKYQGGIGGLFVPAYQKINKWNKATPVSFDMFGHHHQYLDGGAFHCNGSLIGFDGRAEALGFGFEPPMQTLLLVDKKRGQTAKWPVLVDAKSAR